MKILLYEPLIKQSNGQLTILENTAEIHEVALSAVSDSSGRLILCGYAQIPGQDQDAAMWRYYIDGTRDTTFGTNGRITWDSPMGNDDYLQKVKINPDGTIIVGGGANNNSANPHEASILMGKFDSNGQPDTSFSPNGFKTTNVNNSILQRKIRNSYIDSSGRLFSTCYFSGSDFDAGTIRSDNSGNIDTSFAASGYFQFDSSQSPFNQTINKEYVDSILVNSGYVYIIGPRDFTADSYILKLQESDGTIVDGISSIPFKNEKNSSFIKDDYIYIAGKKLPNQYYGWAKIDKNNLTFDASYGTGGSYIHNNNPGGQPNALYVNSIGEAYIGGYQNTVPLTGYIVKATSSGAVDTNWANNGEQIYSNLGFTGSTEQILHIFMHSSGLTIVGSTELMINSTPCKRIFLDVLPE